MAEPAPTLEDGLLRYVRRRVGHGADVDDMVRSIVVVTFRFDREIPGVRWRVLETGMHYRLTYDEHTGGAQLWAAVVDAAPTSPMILDVDHPLTLGQAADLARCTLDHVGTPMRVARTLAIAGVARPELVRGWGVIVPTGAAS